VYFTGLGPVKDGTPMNLYSFSGGGGSAVRRSLGAFLILGAFATIDVLAASGAMRSPDRAALPSATTLFGSEVFALSALGATLAGATLAGATLAKVRSGFASLATLTG
jgi:hypothetical protein